MTGGEVTLVNIQVTTGASVFQINFGPDGNLCGLRWDNQDAALERISLTTGVATRVRKLRDSRPEWMGSLA